MTDANGIFNTSGKIPTDSDFWAQDIEWANEVGFTKYFSKVLGEQVFAPLKKPQLAFYNAFAGRPITAGKGWTERILKKSIAKHYKPNASAEDDLKFYESQGYEWYFGVNTGGWRPVSLPSDLESIEVMLKRDGVGQLNDLLVENVRLDYQRDVESELQMKLVTTCKNSVDVNPTDYVGLIHTINDIVTKMRGTTVHYNDVTTYRSTGETINDHIYTNSDEVFVFIYAGLLKKIQESLGGMPSPDKLTIDGTVIPLVDPLPKPLTTVQWTAGQSAQGWDSNIEPSNLDGDAPLVLICSSKRCEYRPLLDGYKMNLSKNGAGDFTNVHLIWRAGLCIRPWENCCIINGDDTITDETPALIVKDIGSSRVAHSITITASPEVGGTVTSSESSAVQGTEITVTQTAAAGYQFANWWSDQVSILANKFTMPDEDVSVEGIFLRLHSVTCVVSPSDSGTLVAEPSTGLVGGATVTITVTPASGYFFDHYESDDFDVSEIYYNQFNMPDKDVTLTAVFTSDSPGEATPEVVIYGDDGEEFTEDQTNTVVANPLICGSNNHFETDDEVTIDGKKYLFLEWVIDGHPTPGAEIDYFIDSIYVGETVPVDVAYGRGYPIMLTVDPYSPTPSLWDYTTLGRTWNVSAGPVIQPGYHFVRWETSTSGVTIDDPTSASTQIRVGYEAPESGQIDVKIVTEAD